MPPASVQPTACQWYLPPCLPNSPLQKWCLSPSPCSTTVAKKADRRAWENCPELLYRLQLAAEREAEAEQEARAAFWRLWKTPYERVKRVRPANQRDDVQWG